MGEYDEGSWWREVAVSLLEHVRREVGIVTLDELTDVWLEERRRTCSLSYVVQCETIARLLLEAAPPRALIHAVNADHVRAVLAAAAARGCSVRTLQTYRKLMNIFFGWVAREGYHLRNIAADVELPREARPPKQHQYLPTEFVVPFLAACDTWFRPVAATALLAGLRRKECTRLQWEDVLPDRLRIPCAKKREAEWREVPLHPRLADELEQAPRVRGSRWVFPVLCRRSGRQPGDRRADNCRWFLDQVRRATARLGLPPRAVSFQGLRATFAILAQESSGDDWLVAKLLGHSTGTGRRETIVAQTYYLFNEWRRMVECIQGFRLAEVRPLRRAE